MSETSAKQGAAPTPSGLGYSLIVTAFSVLLAVLVVFLSFENRRLRGRLAEALAAESPDATGVPGVPGTPEERPRLVVGDYLGDLSLRTPDGAPFRLAFDGEARKTLLLVFTEGCKACPGALSVWLRVLADLPEDVRVVGVQLDISKPLDEIGGERVPFPVYTLGELSAVPVRELMTVPLTAVIDLAGFVGWVRYGLLDAPAEAALREALAAE